MRVAYVCTDPGVPAFGNKGSSVHVQAVLGVLAEQGAEVHLVTPRPGEDPPLHLAGVHVHRLFLPPARTPASREVAARRADDQVAGVLDLLAAHDPLDLVYERHSLWGRTATRWAEHNGVASVLEVNAPLVDEQARHRVLVDRTAADQIATEALSRAGTVVCVSDRVADWARARSRNPGRVHTVPNGVNTHRIRPAETTPASTPFTIGFVGTLKPWHGVADLVSAIAILAETDRTYRLLIVGDGPEAESLEAQVRRDGVEDMVEMTGAVDPQDMPRLLHRMHVAAAPYPVSPDFYFSPLKVYEYFAAGLPVVATRVGDLPSVLGDGRLGLLTEPGNPGALAAACEALRADENLRWKLGRQARCAAEENHDWTQVVSHILELTEVSRATV
jgi:glycosyltransferase involved in cell wall biosynthesis